MSLHSQRTLGKVQPAKQADEPQPGEIYVSKAGGSPRMVAYIENGRVVLHTPWGRRISGVALPVAAFLRHYKLAEGTKVRQRYLWAIHDGGAHRVRTLQVRSPLDPRFGENLFCPEFKTYLRPNLDAHRTAQQALTFEIRRIQPWITQWARTMSLLRRQLRKLSPRKEG